MREHWTLDPEITFLNHGSFGACPRAVLEEHRIEVPIPPWPAPPKRLVRISAHLYNETAEYERLANTLRSLLQDTPGT